MGRPAVSVLVPALFVVVAVGCGNYVKRAGSLYADGRYIEAAEVFERTEHRLGEYSPKERSEYGLYRGMTLLVLGDLRHAQRWLAYAYEVERAHPGSLRSDRRALLDRGWFELGQRLRNSAPLPSPPGTALAASGAPEAPLPRPEKEPESGGVQENTLVPR
jgi:hypothetical protein